MTTISVDTVAGVRDRIRDASRRGARLRVTGRGTWLDAGRPVRANETISTEGLSGITEYVPGDLTLTARAGTTLGEIRAATGAHGQWLALDPFGSDEGTIGATVATASAGPLFTYFGRPRDLVLGLEFVTGTGIIARGGGRVVKNVAGFDLTRLLTGSWGTLGLITEVAVRLHARPEADESIAISLGGGHGAHTVQQLLRRLPFVPYACEVVNEALAQTLVGKSELTALVRMGGNAESVRAQRAALAELGDVRSIDAAVWQQLRSAEPAKAIVFRLSRLPSEIDRAWDEAAAVASDCPGTMIHASPVRGVVRCIVPTDSTTAPQSVLDLFRSATTTKRVGERLTSDAWTQIASPLADALPSRLKQAFDPRGVLNPGIFGETK
ncbi:MAG TPA: FAD-binding protein [Gemmatimonadaceae bacterium]